MATPTITTEQILVMLQKQSGNRWDEVPGVFIYTEAIIDSENKKSFKVTDRSMGVKLFVDSKTMEVKSFVSKFTDEPITKDLS